MSLGDVEAEAKVIFSQMFFLNINNPVFCPNIKTYTDVFSVNKITIDFGSFCILQFIAFTFSMLVVHIWYTIMYFCVPY